MAPESSPAFGVRALRKSLNRGLRPKSRFPACSPYSRLLDGDERIRECASVLEPATSPPDPHVRTMVDVFSRGALLSNDGPCLGQRDSNGKIGWLKYSQVSVMARRIGSALVRLGIEAGQQALVAVSGLNSVQYALVGHATSLYSMVLVPLYHNYKFTELQSILNRCQIQVMFCQTLELAQRFAKDGTTNLQHIIVLESDHDIPEGKLTAGSVNIYSWAWLLEQGQLHDQAPTLPDADDVYMICHTSGTTGAPKGAMITHKNLLATMAGPNLQWFNQTNKFSIGAKDCYLSFLSMAHVYEQIMHATVIYNGSRIAFYSGQITKLVGDIQTFKPTIMALVPRVLAKFKQQIELSVGQKGKFVQKLFGMGVARKKRLLQQNIVTYQTVWDKLVFRGVHNTFGGRLRLIVTGGAPISEELKTFSSVVFGCPVFEGYGQTECAAAGTLTLPGDTGTGHVGGPSPWAQIKLVSVPSMGYESAQDQGEICFRGAGVMKGYFNDPELTDRAIDADGWLHTGDIGQWLPNGALRIIDRKNNIFKLAQGDFVSPEAVEHAYSGVPFVKQIFVDGKATAPHLVAVLVVDEMNLRKTTAEYLQSAQTKQMVLNSMHETGKKSGLSSIEQVKGIHLTTEEFTLEAGLLTPTLKMKRTQIRVKYADQINKLYNN